VALLIGLSAPATVLAFGDTATATNCTLAAGSSATNNTINCGIPPDASPAIIAAATQGLKSLTEEQRRTIDELQKHFGVDQEALKAFFAILGENEVPPERLTGKLLEIAQHYKDALSQLAPAAGDGPVIAKVKAAAKDALEAGQLTHANELLDQLPKLQNSATETRQLELASTFSQRGQIALTELRYTDAARLFADAAKLVPLEREDIRIGYLDQEAEALYRQGDERGDNGALATAIEQYHLVLTFRTRDRVPLDWARTQMNLGNALVRLGERENSTARLEEAVAAYRAALEERTRDRVPLDWAVTQNNLGVALATLGDRESGTAHLMEAVAAYRAALEESTRDRVPLQWARTQNNLVAEVLEVFFVLGRMNIAGNGARA
jgi:tetratricopeptide (TPR) repeat protein